MIRRIPCPHAFAGKVFAKGCFHIFIFRSQVLRQQHVLGRFWCDSFIRANCSPSGRSLSPVSNFYSMKRLEYFYSPQDEVLAHRWVIPSIKLAGTHLYSWSERGTMRFKCLAQEHNTMSPARVWTQTARSGFERTDHFSRLIYIQTVFPISGFNLSSQFVRNELLLSRSFCLDLNLDL